MKSVMGLSTRTMVRAQFWMGQSSQAEGLEGTFCRLGQSQAAAAAEPEQLQECFF